jgi:hypothetical protein
VSHCFKHSMLPLCFLVTLVLSACAPAQENAPPAAEAESTADPSLPLWTVTEGISTPESVYVDVDSGSIFVSQVIGVPTEADGMGRIVRLGMDGAVVDTDWVTGLDAPKGLRSYAGVLWTADIDKVIGFDIATGDEVARVLIDGAQFLNDVAVGGDGTVYVSDMMANRIYSVQDGTATVFAEGEQLEWPNGLLVEGGRLVVGGWGEPAADFTTEVPGRLFALDLETKEKSLITAEPFANIDGVESDGTGGYIITDFIAGKVLHVSGEGSVSDVNQFASGTADHAFLAESGVVILPHMNENRVAAYDVSSVLD